ncbi:MFS transporter [Brevibacterium sp. BRM-1]|uniref:MFS transporter n=1 Tax=Brevibacterium sp. BRM-1 TaxID=2999062 RepID=UPI00227F7552|nr:MFS transporter [Brevibacterium sp. BRM-1]WAL41270.1 MFS transporter [Brevibacterium sp. BRM-1]
MTPPHLTSTQRSIGAVLDRLPVGRVHRRVVIAVGLGLFFDMYEVFLASSMNVALGTTFAISGLQLKLLLASAFVGMFVGAVCLGRLADRIGRRRAFLLTLAWYSLWSLIAAFSPNAWFLVFARFMAGIGVGAEYPVGDVYLSDVLPKDKRGRLATWAYTCSFIAVPVVGFLALWLNAAPPLGIAGWRWLLALGGLGAVAVLFLRRRLPESPRWLASAGRNEEAQAALDEFAAGSGVDAEELQAIEARAGGVDAEAPEPAQQRLSRLFRPPYLRRLGMLAVFHLFQTFGYYGFGTLSALVLVSRGYDVTHSLLFTALSFLGYPLGSLLSTPLIARFERKHLLIAATVAMAVSGILFATSDSEVLIVVFGFLTTAISNVFSNAFHIYQAEIFPTALRATAVGWTYSLSRLSSGALPFILLPVLEDYGALPMYLVVSAALLIICAAIGFLGPRTTRRSLAEINPA